MHVFIKKYAHFECIKVNGFNLTLIKFDLHKQKSTLVLTQMILYDVAKISFEALI